MNSPRFPSRSDLDLCTLDDRQVLRRRLRGLEHRRRQGQPYDQGLAKLWQAIDQSRSLLERRRSLIPAVEYPPELPVSERREEVAKLIESHQVVVLCGETGSGKSTQLPKICLELGRGVLGRIGHTQPRRIAARSLASRVSQELGTELGTLVGYKVRFHDRVRPETSIKLMTDGMLLAEIAAGPVSLPVRHAHHRRGPRAQPQHRLPARLPEGPAAAASGSQADHHLRHHRSRALLPALRRRACHRGLRAHLSGGGALPSTGGRERRRAGRRHAAGHLARRWTSWPRRGAATCWCSSPGSGRSARRRRPCASTTRPPPRSCPCTPARDPRSRRGFSSPTAARRIVLATNVAETSLTVPGIHYVIDPGFARISRYSHRSKVQRLPVERVSRASANQRKGRCGRVAAGVCIRLYTRGQFRVPRRVHRAGDPAHQPGGGHPADEAAGLRGDRGFPVPRSAGCQADLRRLPDPGGAGGPGPGGQADSAGQAARPAAGGPAHRTHAVGLQGPSLL